MCQIHSEAGVQSILPRCLAKICAAAPAQVMKLELIDFMFVRYML